MGVGCFSQERGGGRQKNAFFEFFLRRLSTHPHPRRSLYTPPVETPAPSAPGQTAAHRRQHSKPRHNQGRQVPGRTDARTLDTLHRSALDTRQAAPVRSYRRWRAGSVSETEQKRTAQNLKNKYAKKSKYLLTFTQESV